MDRRFSRTKRSTDAGRLNLVLLFAISRVANVWIPQACLLKRPKKKDARVVLEVCEPQEGSEQNSEQLRVALGVFSPVGLENASLDMFLTSRMGLRMAGQNITGAVIHIVGNVVVGGISDLEAIDMPDILSVLADAGDAEMTLEAQEGDSDEELMQITPEFEVVDQADIDRAETLRRVKENAGDGKLVVQPKPGQRRDALPLITHRSGLQFQDILLGSGKKVVKGHNVALSYVLRLENGKIVDKATRKRPFKFRLGIGECVKGFDIGVMGMREGGERHLIVPPKLGYGREPPPGIPRNATLYFDIAVIKAF